MYTALNMLNSQILRKGRCRVDKSLTSVSVRRFASFGLVQTEVIAWEDVGEEPECDVGGQRRMDLWYKYTCSKFPDYTARVRSVTE